MRTIPHTEPAQDALDAIGGRKPDGPDKRLVARNVNRYRDRASYPAGAPGAERKLGTPYGG